MSFQKDVAISNTVNSLNTSTVNFNSQQVTQNDSAEERCARFSLEIPQVQVSFVSSCQLTTGSSRSFREKVIMRADGAFGTHLQVGGPVTPVWKNGGHPSINDCR